MLQWKVDLSRVDSPAPGHQDIAVEGPKLRRFVTAITGHHNDGATGPSWPPIRIAGLTTPTRDASGSLSLVWLPGGRPPRFGAAGEVQAVGASVLQVTDVGVPTTISLADLLIGPEAAEAEFRTLTPLRLTRRVGDRDVDVLLPREDLIMTSILNDWNAIAATDDSAGPVPAEAAQQLLADVVVSGHRGLHVVSRVVKRDPRTGAPHHRRAFTGTWRLRLIGGDRVERRWFAALMRLAAITGVGRDHGIGGGRVFVQVPPPPPADGSSPRGSNHRARPIPAAALNPTGAA